MKSKANTIDEILSPLLQRFQKDTFARKEVNEKPPLRSELFNTEQMALHAVHLAEGHQLSKEPGPELLLKRLAENENILFEVTNLLHDDVRNKKSITPAGEWLLDNFYLIEEQIRIAKRYLPKGYSKALPRLSKGPTAGFPRVYDIAIQIISHSDGRVDIQSLSNFISAYQKTTYLTIGELWAIPIMIRLALLENLSRVAARIAVDRIDTTLANEWGSRIMEVVEENPKELILVTADMARSKPPMVSAFVAELTRKLQWKGLDLTLPLTWIEQHLSEMGSSINIMVLAENQKQAADQLSMSNSINSLRFLAKMDWRDFVESMSIVEQTLREDIGGLYALMDFRTRDSYRHAVEKIAKNSNLSEYEVARAAINLAKKSAAKEVNNKRKAHVGYYLIDKGLPLTEYIARTSLTPWEVINKALVRSAPALYFVVTFLITLGISGALVYKAYNDGVNENLLVVVAVLAALVSSQFALILVNWWATLWIKPKHLPKMNFFKGIPAPFRTLVVVPSMIVDHRQAEKLLEDLEVRFLANRDSNLLFALLTDFTDSEEQALFEDDALIAHVQNGIEKLNQKYGRLSNDTFFLFHRPRQWNAKQNMWMGYERKRGKLGDLNRLLRGEGEDRFSVVVGDAQVYSTVKYVITLDSDTQLPRDSASTLVGIMAHPLNQPVYNEKKKRVDEGYGIIQPRIAISLHNAVRSRYSRLNENDTGIDPYTRVVSDVYQDVFAEGSFIGKGIYDVDIFEKALCDRFPENRILSHDLLEGSYTRCGFASDVQFYEDYPSKYLIDISRRHRWIRGDWQIGNWFLPFVPEKNKSFRKNPINALARWKIADNLRRSLVPIALFALIVLSWTVLPNALFWFLCLTGIVIVPPVLISAWNAIMRKPPEVERTQHLTSAFESTYKSLLQALFTLVCLPYEAYISIDAIGRTLWRMIISRKRLLEWNPSGLIQIRDKSLLDTFGSMAVAPIVSGIIFIYLVINNPGVLFIAIPVLIVWAVSPAIEWWLGLPLPAKRTKITDEQQYYLHELARKTWAFFENLVGPADNWLPPDNLQEYPIQVVAHRTSPTNIGLSLLSNLAAYDFGYATTGQLLQRTGNTFATMEKMDRYFGHFYNWYDTQSLNILHPRYISSVDSGNLAGHLLTLRQGLLGLKNKKIVHPRLMDALHDTLRVAITSDPQKHSTLLQFKKAFEENKNTPFVNLKNVKSFLESVADQHNHLMESLAINSRSELYRWLSSLGEEIRKVLDEIILLAPWISSAPIPDKYKSLSIFRQIPTLGELAEADNVLQADLENLRSSASPEEADWLDAFTDALELGSSRARERINHIESLAIQCTEFADMEYSFLYDSAQHLLAIGYNVDDHHRDSSYYDLLASEARLSSFVAIAQGKLPQENWFALGRRLTTADNIPVLLSWSASMFEYLMPALVMPSYENTLLDETCKGTVQRHIEYGKQQNVPWGISESCYNIVDSSLIYQYKAFGVPGLGFKRGLGMDLVIAPYATVLALMVDPQAACTNLETMRELGFEGKFGFFEAIDYTPARLPRGQSHVVIQTFMAHHQGMSLLALAHLLLDKPMQKRFEADPQFQTALLLLQEQVPKTTGFYTASAEMEDITPISSHGQIRIIHTPDTPTPEVQFLSNGRYHVMMTNAGGGYSRWKELAVTRWREDSTLDNWGSFCYIRNLDTNELWSNTYQPTLKEADQYSAVFSQGRVEYRRRDHDIETYTEIIVSPEDDIEIRRIHISNRSRKKVNLELTSYAEAVMAVPVADASHPAFSNLFVQTEIIQHQHAILCTRRARSKDERPPWMFHLMKMHEGDQNMISYETDRHKFIGRGQSLLQPKALTVKEPLSGSQGSVLDPIVSIQHRLVIDADDTIVIDIVTGISETRETSKYLIDKYQDRNMRDRAFELSWTHSQVVLRQINATEEDAELYGRLASSVIYMNPALRASSNILIKNQRGQSALWSYSISGDLPIVLLQVSDSNNITLIKQLVQAQAYWQLKGLAVDLVILNEDPSGYRQVLQEQIQGLIAAGMGISSAEKQGRIYVRPVDQVTTEDRILLQAVARVIITDSRGSLVDQVNRKISTKTTIPYLAGIQTYAPISSKLPAIKNLLFANGTGGFTEDGKEYIITTKREHTTPLPWINVIANRNFGTIVSESGSSYTWSENAHGFRITPWHNDPVTDGCGEAFYIRDEENGMYWSPMPYPHRSKSLYRSHHGFGYSWFEHANDGIQSEARIYVDIEAPVKFIVLKIRNVSGRARKLSATGYMEWVLGSIRGKESMHVVTEMDTMTGALIARNAYNTEFSNRVAFFDVDELRSSFTADRTEFIGRNGTLRNPEALKRTKLSGKWGAGLDPCAALQVAFDLEDGGTREVVFRMGAGKDRFEAERTIKQFRGVKVAAQALEKVHAYWQHALSAVQIETPDPSLNILSNGWLVYQVLSCRLWGRSGFYQSGGAFGFRDQLQDVLALMHADAQLTRDQILMAASRQFKEGDVQHWWHPPVGRGVRTLCSDDFMWLPYVTSRYVTNTGDTKILEESTPFLDGRFLNAMEESYYDLPIISEVRASLYDHCKRAIQHGLRFGEHGLPLMGSGDWNDGMNMVGIHGKGESVWLGFFLYDVLQRFIPIAELNNDASFVEQLQKASADLKNNIDKHAWDGQWYRRAYFDDGTPLGSSQNEECMIDSIAQSWSILSNAGDKEKTEMAMKSVQQYLINREKGLIQLLEPPFNTADMDPGYIKGYVPGVRENGGQYTHAAIWMVMAFAKIKDHKHTWELLNMINPINHGKTAEDVSVYKAEPYVMAADVYGVHPHTGRGGWTWYTGSAGWMYQLILESFLGLKREGDELWFEPCIPAEWNSFKVKYRFKNTHYYIDVISSTDHNQTAMVDGVEQSNGIIKLIDDNGIHAVILKCPTFTEDAEPPTVGTAQAQPNENQI
ncbi:glycoside hydrolase family 94 protein [Chryseolinea sp. H1M3-3]|uniref:glycoside hydrolase family 94 protein n=1 Tax=Chryseolinea sp. H1M3-3 TaxID=3034144 RepID=UPI0023EB6E79|nr:glycoside hydrolase family 94 protein [Chryseolinea sp. H1M3-3]